MDLRRWLRIRPTVLSTVVTFTLCLVTHAGEGASTNYFPGSYGDFAVAIAPEPGWIYANYNQFYSADADAAVLQGRVNTGLDTFAYINMSAGLFVFDKPVLGGRFAVGSFVPLGYVELESELVSPIVSVAVDESETALGDIALLPASFYWNKNNCKNNVWHNSFKHNGTYFFANARKSITFASYNLTEAG